MGNNENSKTVAELLNCGTFFILTSPIEGCGISIFEDMVYNLFVIVFRASLPNKGIFDCSGKVIAGVVAKSNGGGGMGSHLPGNY